MLCKTLLLISVLSFLSGGVAAQELVGSVDKIKELLLTGYNEADGEGVEYLFDDEMFWRRTQELLSPEALSDKEVEQAVKDAMSRLPEVLRARGGAQARWKLLDERTVRGTKQKQLFFRVLGKESFHYWSLMLDEVENGFRISDWYDNRTGTWYSQYTAAMLEMMFDENTNFNRWKLALMPEPPATVLDFLSSVGSRSKTVKDTWRRLPESARYEANVMILFLDSISQVDEETWMTEIKRFNELYGGEKRYQGFLLDYYLKKRDFSAAMKAVKLLSRRVDDPWLSHYMSGVINSQKKSYAKAINALSEALKMERGFEHTYWVLLDTLVYAGRFDDASFLIGLIEKRYATEFDPKKLTELPGYGEFSKSSPFKGWLNARKKEAA